MRHKHADLIHAWAEGAEIECFDRNTDEWFSTKEPSWWSDTDYRIKPKNPEWWENIPEHGILAESVLGKYVAVLKAKPNDVTEWIPLTNEEIERFKR